MRPASDPLAPARRLAAAGDRDRLSVLARPALSGAHGGTPAPLSAAEPGRRRHRCQPDRAAGRLAGMADPDQAVPVRRPVCAARRAALAARVFRARQRRPGGAGGRGAVAGVPRLLPPGVGARLVRRHRAAALRPAPGRGRRARRGPARAGRRPRGRGRARRFAARIEARGRAPSDRGRAREPDRR